MFTKYLLLTRQRLPQKVLLFNPTENRILNSLFWRNFLETQNDHFQTLAVVIQKTGSEDFLPCCRYQFYIHFFALMESLKPSFTLLSICSGRSCCHQILRSKSLRFIVPAVLPIRFLRTEREPYSAVPRWSHRAHPAKLRYPRSGAPGQTQRSVFGVQVALPVFSFICSDFRVANLPDPHRDPHGETSGWKQWIQEVQRALISEQKVLKTSKNRCFYSFSTIRNQQVAGSSPATSSRNQRKS